MVLGAHMRDLHLFEISCEVVAAQVPQMRNESTARRRKQTALRVELREVDLFVLTSLPEVDAELVIVLERLYSQLSVGCLHSGSHIMPSCSVVQATRQQTKRGCHHSVYLLLLLLLLLLRLTVSVLQEVSLLRRIGPELTHHVGQLVVL